MDNRKTTAKKNLSINDQLQAMQSGELVCSPEKLSACIAYCRGGWTCSTGRWRARQSQRTTWSRPRQILQNSPVFSPGQKNSQIIPEPLRTIPICAGYNGSMLGTSYILWDGQA